MVAFSDIRAVLSVIVVIGGGVLLVLDGPLVERLYPEIIAFMGFVVAYWFGSAASLGAPRQVSSSDPNVDPGNLSSNGKARVFVERRKDPAPVVESTPGPPSPPS
jgi:hypothetical protein